MAELAILLLILSQQSAGILACQLDAFSEEVRANFEEVEVEGHYQISFEVRAFTPITSEDRWWVVSADLNELMRLKGASKLRIVIHGLLSPEGEYGHTGRYRHCLANPKVIKVVEPPTEG